MAFLTSNLNVDESDDVDDFQVFAGPEGIDVDDLLEEIASPQLAVPQQDANSGPLR